MSRTSSRWARNRQDGGAVRQARRRHCPGRRRSLALGRMSLEMFQQGTARTGRRISFTVPPFFAKEEFSISDQSIQCARGVTEKMNVSFEIRGPVNEPYLKVHREH